MKGNRARAIIVNADKILLIQRELAGDIYYVLPGGSIEPGETPEATVMREVKEETSLQVALKDKIEILVDKDGTTHHLFVCEYISGEPSLAADSPELTKETGGHVYTPMWIEVQKIKDIPMWPAEVKPFLIKYFGL